MLKQLISGVASVSALSLGVMASKTLPTNPTDPTVPIAEVQLANETNLTNQNLPSAGSVIVIDGDKISVAKDQLGCLIFSDGGSKSCTIKS